MRLRGQVVQTTNAGPQDHDLLKYILFEKRDAKFALKSKKIPRLASHLFLRVFSHECKVRNFNFNSKCAFWN